MIPPKSILDYADEWRELYRKDPLEAEKQLTSGIASLFTLRDLEDGEAERDQLKLERDHYKSAHDELIAERDELKAEIEKWLKLDHENAYEYRKMRDQRDELRAERDEATRELRREVPRIISADELREGQLICIHRGLSWGVRAIGTFVELDGDVVTIKTGGSGTFSESTKFHTIVLLEDAPETEEPELPERPDPSERFILIKRVEGATYRVPIAAQWFQPADGWNDTYGDSHQTENILEWSRLVEQEVDQ